MSWTYNPTDNTPLYQVRLYTGDNDATDPLLQDEEIAFILADEGNDVYRAVVTACETLAAKYSRRATSGGQQNGVLAQHFMDLARRFRRKMARSGISPFVGGQSIAAKANNTQNPDLVQPSFSRDQFSEPGTSPSDGQTLANDIPPWAY